MAERKMAVAGHFYPDGKEELNRYIEYFNKSFSVDEINIDTRAIISPHAGYIYSGFTANLAFNISSKKRFKRVIVIGPSHRVYLEGASVALYENYETPLGNIEIDLEYSTKLKEKYSFLGFVEKVHEEHSTETQAPFIKNYFDNVKLIEIIYGKLDYEKLSMVIDELLEDKNNLIVISTDLSHFYNLEEAQALDSICIDAIANRKLERFDEGCEACGIIGVKAIVKSALKNNLITKMLHYCTSYDRTNDAKSVVGYTSFLIGEEIK